MSDIKNITFKKRPVSLAPDYRPIYKVSQIVLVLGICCRANKASLLVLHLFMWAMKSERNAMQLNNWVCNDDYNLPVWGMEPTLNRGLQYTVAEQLCEKDGGSYKLTSKGQDFFQLLLADAELMQVEKQILTSIGKKITNKKIDSLTQKWKYAKD
ncbi:MAG: hypothetical protein SNJ28_05940 [Rikenellaceae bacterium]